MRVPFLAVKPAYEELRAELDAAFARVMRSGWFVLGPEVEAFEHAFAAYCGARHCVGVGNGLEAMVLTLRAWGIGPGDEVIVPSNTYIATWLAVTAVGAIVVPVEPTPAGPNIDPERIAAAITSRTVRCAWKVRSTDAPSSGRSRSPSSTTGRERRSVMRPTHSWCAIRKSHARGSRTFVPRASAACALAKAAWVASSASSREPSVCSV